MGSPLAPVLANLFMGRHEKIWLENYQGPEVIFSIVDMLKTHSVYLTTSTMLYYFLTTLPRNKETSSLLWRRKRTINYHF